MSVWDDDREDRRLYQVKGEDSKIDPLRLRRSLIELSQGTLWKQLKERREAIVALNNAKVEEELSQPELRLARSENLLIEWTRKAFEVELATPASLSPKKKRTDAEWLRELDRFIVWLEGKG